LAFKVDIFDSHTNKRQVVHTYGTGVNESIITYTITVDCYHR